MKTPETMTREELVAYCRDLKRMITGLQTQLTKALEEVAKNRLPVSAERGKSQAV